MLAPPKPQKHKQKPTAASLLFEPEDLETTAPVLCRRTCSGHTCLVLTGVFLPPCGPCWREHSTSVLNPSTERPGAFQTWKRKTMCYSARPSSPQRSESRRLGTPRGSWGQTHQVCKDSGRTRARSVEAKVVSQTEQGQRGKMTRERTPGPDQLQPRTGVSKTLPLTQLPSQTSEANSFKTRFQSSQG